MLQLRRKSAQMSQTNSRCSLTTIIKSFDKTSKGPVLSLETGAPQEADLTNEPLCEKQLFTFAIAAEYEDKNSSFRLSKLLDFV